MIKGRIKDAKMPYRYGERFIFKYNKVLTSHDINLAKNATSNDEQIFEVFKMWVYRRILKLPFTDRVPNTEAARRMNLD